MHYDIGGGGIIAGERSWEMPGSDLDYKPTRLLQADKPNKLPYQAVVRII